MKRALLIALVVVLMSWVAWPYFSVYRVERAIKARDFAAFENFFVWDSVRKSIKADLNLALTQSIPTPKGNAGLAAGLIGAFMPAILNRMVDAYTTPSGLAKLLPMKMDNIKYAFFGSPTSFLVELGNLEGKREERIKVMMKFEQFGWKIAAVHFPFEEMLKSENKLNAKSMEPFKAGRMTTKQADELKSAPTGKAATAYISKIKLYDLNAKYFDSVLDGRIPGVTFKLKNEGGKTLNKVEVTVYFKDRKGHIITEETFRPVFVTEFSFGKSNKPLKPGYIWQLERGKFYSAKSVPSEWAAGSVEAKITKIEFAQPK